VFDSSRAQAWIAWLKARGALPFGPGAGPYGAPGDNPADAWTGSAFAQAPHPSSRGAGPAKASLGLSRVRRREEGPGVVPHWCAKGRLSLSNRGQGVPIRTTYGLMPLARARSASVVTASPQLKGVAPSHKSANARGGPDPQTGFGGA
jgi:hypothetical protein